jgi:sortase A
MRKKLSTIILVVMLFLGLSLLLYPAVSNYINSMLQSGKINDYIETTSKLSDEDYTEILNKAKEYNNEIARTGINFELSDEQEEIYNQTLKIADDGLMSYIDIPSINCTLPIYHGTDDSVLQVGVGHIEGSSLPIGGSSTHCILLAHRGLPSAKLFSALDKLTIGDTFTLYTLDETLTYEVDELKIVDGMDYCTLVTCTPYGVNTHRLLVRGHRIANPTESDLRITADATQFDTIIVAPFAAIPIILVMMILLFVGDKNKRRHKAIEKLIEKEEKDSEKKT